jgi:hypothetical protein
MSYNVYYIPVEKTDRYSIAIEALIKLGDRSPLPNTLKALLRSFIFVGGYIAYENWYGDCLLAEGYALSRRLLHTRGRLLHWQSNDLFCPV